MANIKIEDLKNRKEFHIAFEVTRYDIFEVSFYTLGSNKSAHFSTSANRLNRRKSDYTQCGQAQESVLPKGSKARNFYELWDDKHLSDLTDDEYNEMVEDLKTLAERYNYILIDNERDHIPFMDIVCLSKQELKPKPSIRKIRELA